MNLRIKRRDVVVGILLMGFLINGVNHLGAAEKPYKTGHVVSLTGTYSQLGEQQRRASIMYQEEVNKAGGINGHPLEVIILDSQSDPSKAVTALKSLFRDPEIAGICGGSSSAESLAMIPVSESEGIPYMSYGGSTEIADPTKKWVFQLPTPDRGAMRDILNFLKKRNLTKIAMIHSTGGYGKSGAERLKEQASGAGFTVLGYESFSDKDIDMTPQLTRIRDLNPQAIISWTATTAGAILSKNVKQLGIKALHIHDNGFGYLKYLKVAGDAVNGDIVPLGKVLIAQQLDSSDPQKKMLLDFKQRYERRWDEPVANGAAYATDGFMILKKAIEAVGPDRGKVRNYIENLKNFMGYYRVYTFGPDDHGSRETSALVMVEVVNQNWKLIKD